MAFCLRSENAHEANELVKKFSRFLYHSALEKNYIASQEDIYYNRTPLTPTLQKSEKFVIVQLKLDVCTLNVKNTIVCTISLIFVLPTLTPSRNVNEFQTV